MHYRFSCPRRLVADTNLVKVHDAARNSFARVTADDAEEIPYAVLRYEVQLFTIRRNEDLVHAVYALANTAEPSAVIVTAKGKAINDVESLRRRRARHRYRVIPARAPLVVIAKSPCCRLPVD